MAANRLKVVKKDDGTLLQAVHYGSSNARLFELDYQFGYLKIFFTEGGTTISEYTEFAHTVPTWTKSYIYFGDNVLSTITPNGSGGEVTEYSHPDSLGTKAVTRQEGLSSVNYEISNLPFGTALNAESTGTQSRRFTSYERDGTGLDYAINRTYDSKQGRFTQVDPIGINASDVLDPQTLNLYTYCGNDPINHVDPDGLFFKKLFKWIGKVFNVLKWVALVVAVVTVIAITAFVFAPAASVVFKAAAWFLFKAMPFISKYMSWAIGSTGSGGFWRTPSINPGSGGGWGNFSFPDEIIVDGGVLAVVVVDIKWYERVGTFLEGFAESLTFGLPSAIDSWMGRTRDIDRDSAEYKAGEITGFLASFIIPGGAGLKGIKGIKALKGLKWGGKFGIHGAHHTFGRFGKLAHLQLNLWWKGARGSGWVQRIPLPFRKKFKDIVLWHKK